MTNRLRRTCYPGGSNCSGTPTAPYEENLSYDAADNLLSRRNRAGEVLSYT